MKKKVLNVTAAIVLALSILATMTGCSFDEIKKAIGSGTPKPSTPASNVCVVVSPTANQHKPDVNLAYDEIYDSCYSYGYNVCVVDDGDPFVHFEVDLTKEDIPDGLSERNKELDAEAYANDFIEKAEEVKAVTAEKDTIKAISLAAASLEGCSGDKTIVLIDNGLSTCGIASFKTFENFDPNARIDALQDYDYPTLENIKIVWYSLADNVAPQDDLSNRDLSNLEDFWTKFLQKAGASDIQFKSKVSVNSTVDNSSLPWVSAIKVTPDTPVPDIDSINERVEKLPTEERNSTFDDALKGGIKFNEESVHFKPDSFELYNKDEAIRIMTPLAEYMKANPDKKIVLLGTTATSPSKNQESAVEFGLGRSETIKEILVNDMGVDPANLLTVGLGFENSFHIDDLNDDGSLDETAAPKNRSVIFVDADSNIGKAYL